MVHRWLLLGAVQMHPLVRTVRSKRPGPDTFLTYSIMTSYAEGKDSTFIHLGKQYYVDDLLNISKDRPITRIDVDKLSWILQYSTPDPIRTASVDPEVPILVTTWGTKLVVLDGLHRLAHHVYNGSHTINTKFVSPYELTQLKTVGA